MLFAKRVFQWSGVYGLVVLTPLYFLEGRLNEIAPPAIAHPEHFYGFVGVALSWQVVFLIIGQDPARYRLLMLPAILEKFSFGIATWVLLGLGRVSFQVAGGGTIDLVLGMLFAVAYLKTKPAVEQGEELDPDHR